MLFAFSEAYYYRINRLGKLAVSMTGTNMEGSSTLTISNTSTASSGSTSKTDNNIAVTPSTGSAVSKEKKRKGLSSSRLKKFYRHFEQLSSDEIVLNCECNKKIRN